MNVYQSSTWTTRDGQKICITDLKDDHLMNILNMLHRNAFSIEFSISMQEMLALPDDLGDMASFSIENDINERSCDPWGWLKKTPLVQALLDEYYRRLELGNGAFSAV